jgi:hypothetical protein
VVLDEQINPTKTSGQVMYGRQKLLHYGDERDFPVHVVEAWLGHEDRVAKRPKGAKSKGGDDRNRTNGKNTGKINNFPTGGAKSGARTNLIQIDDPQLLSVVASWPILSDPIKRAIRSLIDSTNQNAKS